MQGRNPPSDGPINVTTSVTGYFPYTGNLQAYATTTPDLVTVYLRQEGGLLHAADGLVVPQALTAFGTNSASDEIGQVGSHLRQHALVHMGASAAASIVCRLCQAAWDAVAQNASTH